MRQQFRPPALSSLPNREKVNLGPEWPMPTLPTHRPCVTFTAKDADGETLASVDRDPVARTGMMRKIWRFCSVFSSFAGSLEITSTEPIVTLSLNFEAAPVFSSLPPGEVDAAAQ